ncbi:MAG: ATP-binding cassette domain-containing protein [Promethearchaeota archaeon]|nr:MAG: ATP-binding cassette domain-containing protein [Candidatus Lokiarchaeota archaeon]
MIIIENLTKKFKKVFAVDDVSLTIKDGEIFGLLGPNGAGKSTLIHLISTIIKPDSGTAIINGYDLIKQAFEVRKMLAVSFQDSKLDWQLNLVETLQWHGKIWHIPQDTLNQRIKDLVESLKLKDSVKKKNWKLSGGTRKKVEVCKTIIARPKIAIFDEPTAFLDPMMKKIIWDYIKELKEEGSTVILATNLMREADILSDRVAIMDKGKIIVVNSPEDLKDSIPGGDIITIILDQNKSNFNQEKIKTDLFNIDNISDVSFNQYIEDPQQIEIKILCNNTKKIAPKILGYFQKNRLTINNYTLTSPTLDDVFFYYTKSYLNP